MRVLVACEYSGRVRDAFIRAGHDAMSCDILPSEAPGPHYQGDALDVLGDGWDLMVAHPPCTFLARVRSWCYSPKWAARYPNQERDREEAVRFFMQLYNAPIPHVCVENPVGLMTGRFRPADQYVQPFFFGDPVRKTTGLWLRGLPLLMPTEVVEPELVPLDDLGRRTESVWMRDTFNLPPGERGKARSKTFPGLAAAMAAQWTEDMLFEQLALVM